LILEEVCKTYNWVCHARGSHNSAAVAPRVRVAQIDTLNQAIRHYQAALREYKQSNNDNTPSNQQVVHCFNVMQQAFQEALSVLTEKIADHNFMTRTEVGHLRLGQHAFYSGSLTLLNIKSLLQAEQLVNYTQCSQVFNNRLLVIDLSATQDEGDIGAAKVEDGYGLDDGTSLALDVLPIVGSAKSAIQLMSGKDLVTGEKVNRWLEAVGIVVGLVPGGKAALKAAAGGATALKKGDKIEGSTKAVNTGKKADDTVVGAGGKSESSVKPNQEKNVTQKRPYSHLKDAPNVGKGKDYTASQKKKIYEENRKINNGILRDDTTGEELVMPKKSKKGVKPPRNEAQIDHIDAKIPKNSSSTPGSNSYKNAQVLSRKNNRTKSNNQVELAMDQILDDINTLPDTSKVKRISQSLAMLDAIIMPEWELRYFSFDCHWDGSHMMASMKNGSGDEYFLLFDQYGVVGKVFVTNVKLPANERNELIAKIPSVFQSFKKEEAFSLDDISFCFWCKNGEHNWISEPKTKNLPHLNFLIGDPELYKVWAEEYYEKEFDIEVIRDIFSHKPLTPEIVAKLNTEISFEKLIDDLDEIGYPR